MSRFPTEEDYQAHFEIRAMEYLARHPAIDPKLLPDLGELLRETYEAGMVDGSMQLQTIIARGMR